MKFLLRAIIVMAVGAGACGELPAESNVVDLRVLGIKSEPAGFLIDLNDPGAGRSAARLDRSGGHLAAAARDASAFGAPWRAPGRS